MKTIKNQNWTYDFQINYAYHQVIEFDPHLGKNISMFKYSGYIILNKDPQRISPGHEKCGKIQNQGNKTFIEAQC